MRPHLPVVLSVAVFSFGTLAYPPFVLQPNSPSVSRLSDGGDVLSRQRAQAVKDAFRIAWSGYETYALPHDELHPQSNTFGNPRNGWGATAVDALDTAILMQESEIVDTILNFIPKIDYDHTDTGVSVFETTIRYLGGMLAGYDLLKGPFSSLTNDTALVDALLMQSKRLADNLKGAFDTPSGVPSNGMDFSTFPPKRDGSDTNGLATIGTLVLEWTRLSDLLGDSTYADLSQKGESFLMNPTYKPGLSSPWPGLLGTNVNLDNGEFQDVWGGWNGGDDSYYEYLIKMFVYDSSKYSDYRDAWIQAADSTIANLASHPSTMPNLTFLAGFNGQQLSHYSGHLACFDGGNFLLAGKVLNEQKYVDFGLALTDSCHATYASQLNAIGPEGFAWFPAPTTTTSSSPTTTADLGLSPSNAAFYAKNGFYNTNGAYVLRPEVVESYYYAYRATGDDKYRQWSWDAFVAINKTCYVGSGYSGIFDVNLPDGNGFFDVQDSFFLAETLKYTYLIQAPDDVFQSFHGDVNEWVFNTEAHLLKVKGPAV